MTNMEHGGGRATMSMRCSSFSCFFFFLNEKSVCVVGLAAAMPNA